MRIEEYDINSYYKIFLDEAENELEQVVISVNEGMTRARKLKEFKREFLGETKNGQSCTILNEEDLILRFNKKTRKLEASAYQPIRIKNEKLGYLIDYEIIAFTIDYGYINPNKEVYKVNGVFYQGTSFYKTIRDIDNKIEKRRDKAYKGSILHFMRAICDQKLIEEDYQVFSSGLLVKPEKYIAVKTRADSNLVDINMRLPFSILYDKRHQTDLIPRFKAGRTLRQKPIFKNKDTTTSEKIRALKRRDTISLKRRHTSYYNTTFHIDNDRNFGPPTAFSFSGYMGALRIGDALPLDFNLDQLGSK